MDCSTRRLLLFGSLLVLLITAPCAADAQVSVGIQIGPPPPFPIAGPPPVVVIPGTYIYEIPDIDADIFFFSGFWYRLYGGHWFRARSYNGPWGFWPDARVPRALITMPPWYRNVPPGYRRIPYGDFRRNWQTWQRTHYWSKDPGWRGGGWHGGPGGPQERHEGVHGGPQERHEGPGRPEGRPGEEREHGFGHEEHEHGR